MRRVASVACALLLLAGCASPPLGDDFAGLEPAAREARAVEVLRELFAERVDGTGEPIADREVLRTDAAGIAWRAEDGGESRLRWADVLSVAHVELRELPARPVNLLVTIPTELPSAATVRELTSPTLAAVGLASPTLRLAHRPARSRERMVAALAELRRGRPPQTASVASPTSRSDPDAPPAGVAPTASATTTLDAVEAELRRLKAWRDEGLITEAEHDAARAAALRKLEERSR